MATFRIFISSPGDVIPERRRAELVIDKLARDYKRFFEIQSYLWETEPMLASGHFQDKITPPADCDMVVLIVWSRLGTLLPEKTARREYRGLDGRVPVTGTEWEFESALEAQRDKGAPDILAYRKTADPTVSLKDRAAKAAAEEQWDEARGFLESPFYQSWHLQSGVQRIRWPRWLRGQARKRFAQADRGAHQEARREPRADAGVDYGQPFPRARYLSL